LLLCLAGAAPVGAQVLAQRNWAGSGVSMQPWWEGAVFYRVDLARFQDSDGDGRGDLPGLTQRLGYLQTLGVDALIIKTGEDPAGAGELMQGFEDLVRASVDSHLRVLVEIGAPASQQADAQYLGLARAWLNQGAAGLYLPTAAIEKIDGAGHIAVLLQQLRALADSFPGGRVLLADAPAVQDKELLDALAKYTQMTASPSLRLPAGADPAHAAAILRGEMLTAMGPQAGSASSRQPLLYAGRPAAATSATTLHTAAKMGLERAEAVMLLASRGAVMLEYGQELGLQAAAAGADPLMQWTASNVTRKPERTKSATTSAPQQRAPDMQFHSYIPPLRRDLFPPPPMPQVEVSDDPAAGVGPPLVEQGFTAGAFDTKRSAANGAAANVAAEQADPASLLHLYEQLIALHHENATLRNGTQSLLNYDAQNALVWVRRAPANSRTSTNVVAGCNLSDKPVALEDTGGVGLRGMRSLVVPRPAGDIGVMAGHAVVVASVR
jgi:alpha-glucosidase